MTTRDVHILSLLLCLFSPNVAAHGRIPTTLDGPFAPRTRRFDPSLRLGSDDVPMDDPKLAKKVGFNFPEQIAIAASFSHTSMWVSWVTGDAQIWTNVIPLDPSTVGSEVWYGGGKGSILFVQNGTAMVYNQLYPFEGLLNHTSGNNSPRQARWLTCLNDQEKQHPITEMGHALAASLLLRLLRLLQCAAGSAKVGKEFLLWLCIPDAPIERHTNHVGMDGEESHSESNFYYSFNAGGIHFIMLGAYIDYNQTGAQYAWLKKDLLKVDREVHAYERMNRVYNYSLNSCGPIYITVGDGGNIEQIDIEHADDPGKCPSKNPSIPEFGGICHLNFSSGPAKAKFCWDQQPEWSAFRESSFGHGILEVINSTYALWTWHRNQDAYKESSKGDQIYIVRQPEICLANIAKVSSKDQ
ncbi:hypothetical protein HPP92_014407 [Vanilla planifolia]|uniref:Purple acid phosphatase C-terminal domain-containing protein n=1 Tax=Vanilla planifolia TaxID=51239 RepID=A0A835QPE6_VANPL|nr:hypothetical protein HPP92_014407 [Vanilla planifolia]